ncbi:11397_t:CDS:2 [Gigaspora margarita]|uniref:11397_t:CDS:1 n=1 Tax=Gigaspora margarita TaxID=4874 RepID=A0ABN7UUH2_GIGMA|nr:11397_t:CDS:2 [Gigaspora margarita]
MLETVIAPGINRWVVCLDEKPEVKVEVSAGCIKFIFTDNSSLEDNDAPTELAGGEPETDISSNSELDQNGKVNISNENRILWTNAIVTIDSHLIHFSYSNAPIVHIANITHVSPRLFFEHFLPFMQFIGILTIMTYVKCDDINDYWSVKQKTGDVSENNDPFSFVQKFHNAFNENLSKAITPEVKRYIKYYSNVTFQRPAIFDEFNINQSAVDILNNLHNNVLSYHNVLASRFAANHILAFYFSVAKANSYSTYCQFVSDKKNINHIDFYRMKKRKNPNSEAIEHDLVSLKNNSSTSQDERKPLT